jgi:hypothetical protein
MLTDSQIGAMAAASPFGPACPPVAGPILTYVNVRQNNDP